MAKPKSEPTAAQKHEEATRTAYQAAKEKYAKAENETNKKAVADLKVKLEAATKAVNRERWLKVGRARGAKVIASMNNFMRCANPRQYEVTEDEIKALSDKLIDKAKATVSEFSGMHNKVAAKTDKEAETLF